MKQEAEYHIEQLKLILRSYESTDLEPREREKLVEAEAELIRFKKKLMGVMER